MQSMRPELALNVACETLTSTLRDHTSVETGVYTLPTAFESTINPDRDGPTVAVLAEYDALPLHWSCSAHNIIATTALGAALALSTVASQLPRQVKLLGTPAEERVAAKNSWRGRAHLKVSTPP